MAVDLAVLRRLYTGPPEEFVAARTATVKELRAAGDRPTAAEVAKLRRPSIQDWALNSVAAEHADAMGAALDAAARMRDAQAAAVEGRGPSDVRSAVAELREHSQRVVSLAADAVSRTGRAAGSLLGTLAARLAEVAANPAAAEQLRNGHLGSEAVEAVDLFAGLAAPPRRARKADPAPPAPESSKSRSRSKPATEEPAEAAGERELRVDARTRRRLERAVAAARKAQSAADAALGKAEARQASAEQAVTAAEAALDDARARLAAAEDERAAAAATSAQAQAALEAAESELPAD
jgi:hypothetical protein